MAEVGEINQRNDQKLLEKTDKPGNLKNAHLWILQCMRYDHIYGANGEDFWQRKCPRCGGGAKGLPIGPMQSRFKLLQTIRRLPDKVNLGLRSQRGRWIRWLAGYYREGYAQRDRSAEFIYNALNNPEMMIWLAAACGAQQSLLAAATDAIDRNASRMTQAASVRRILPWSLVSRYLAQPIKPQDRGALVSDLEGINKGEQSKTTKDTLIEARLGQGQFRARVSGGGTTDAPLPIARLFPFFAPRMSSRGPSPTTVND